MMKPRNPDPRQVPTFPAIDHSTSDWFLLDELRQVLLDDDGIAELLAALNRLEDLAGMERTR